MIDNSSEESELDEIKSKIDKLVENNIISVLEYNHLINLIDEKRNILLELLEELRDDLL